MKSFPDITVLFDVFQIMAQVLPSDGNTLNVICGIAIAVHYSALGTPDVTEDQFLYTVGGKLLFSLFSTGRHEIADHWVRCFSTNHRPNVGLNSVRFLRFRHPTKHSYLWRKIVVVDPFSTEQPELFIFECGVCKWLSPSSKGWPTRLRTKLEQHAQDTGIMLYRLGLASIIRLCNDWAIVSTYKQNPFLRGCKCNFRVNIETFPSYY